MRRKLNNTFFYFILFFVFLFIFLKLFLKVAKFEFTYPIVRGDDTRRWTLNGVMSTMGKITIVEGKHIPVVIQEMEELE